MTTQHNLKPRISDEKAQKLAGTLLTESDYNLLVTYDADVYCSETKRCIAKFRKKIIPRNVAINAYNSLKKAAKHTNNRPYSGGEFNEKGHTTHYNVKKDGTRSQTSVSLTSVNSGIIGYFDRNSRFPYCRQTAFNEKEFDKFKKAYPIIKLVDTKYKELMPEHYALQRGLADSTTQDFVIRDTSFTTVTVNSNWQTAVHTDKGDYEKGFGNLVALRDGRFTGGYFVIPKWGVAFDLQNCDLLLTDVHQWHGNTPIVKIDENAKRVSLVMYYRHNMQYCSTADQEAEIAKRREKGNAIN